MNETLSHVSSYHLKNKLINGREQKKKENWLFFTHSFHYAAHYFTNCICKNEYSNDLFHYWWTRNKDMFHASYCYWSNKDYEIVRFIKNRKWTNGWTIHTTKNAERIWDLPLAQWPKMKERMSHVSNNHLKNKSIKEGNKKRDQWLFICRSLFQKLYLNKRMFK